MKKLIIILLVFILSSCQAYRYKQASKSDKKFWKWYDQTYPAMEWEDFWVWYDSVDWENLPPPKNSYRFQLYEDDLWIYQEDGYILQGDGIWMY